MSDSITHQRPNKRRLKVTAVKAKVWLRDDIPSFNVCVIHFLCPKFGIDLAYLYS